MKIDKLKLGDTIHIGCGGQIKVKTLSWGADYVYVNGIYYEKWTGVCALGYLKNGELDIVSVTPAPERVQGWLNFYPKSTYPRQVSDTLYESRAMADANAHKSRMACLEVDIWEGYGLV